MFKFSTAMTKKAALVIVSCFFAVPANASPTGDYFGHNTATPTPKSREMTNAQLKHEAETPKIGAGAGALMSDDTPVVRWFEAYDRAIADAKPTEEEQIILHRPLNRDLDRVKEMTKTCSDVARRFRLLAKTLRSMPVQSNWGQVKQLRDGQADFYELEASVFEDMIRPRPASRTQEELQSTLDSLQNKASSAASYGKTLLSTDMNLRLQFGVHRARDKDDLAKYVMTTKKDGIYQFPH
ncbi:MAG TPA: hypothetical protein V6C97_15215 [Oculatellaceae cyanobacterium]